MSWKSYEKKYLVSKIHSAKEVVFDVRKRDKRERRAIHWPISSFTILI